MKRSKIAWVFVLGVGGAVATSGCSDDDAATLAGGGASGHAGIGGTAAGGSSNGSSGSSTVGGSSAGIGADAGMGTVAEAGALGFAGEGGMGGALPSTAGEGGTGAGEAGNGGAAGSNENPCGPATPITVPTVASAIAVNSSAVLVAAYAAIGTQTYTCTATTTNAVTSYAWSATSVPMANLYGSACTIAATHYAGPHWKANDGSIILGTKVSGVASASTGSIQQLLLSTVPDAGVSGLFSSVTAVQRLNTSGGSAPAEGCDSTTVGSNVAVPYTASYYFYSGAAITPH